MPGSERVGLLADAIADRLASPANVRGLGLARGWWPQSLAHGAAGVTLLHIERARAEVGSWRRVHDWLACAAGREVVTGAGSHPHHGAPAPALAIHAPAHRPGRYAPPPAPLDHP